MPIQINDNPTEWQTAYSRDQVFNDSESHSARLNTPVLFCFLVFLAYPVILWDLPTRLGQLSLQWAIAYGLGILIVSFLMFNLLISLPTKKFAEDFLTRFYRLPGSIDPSKVINHRLNGKGKVPPPLDFFSQFPYLLVRDGKIEKTDEWPAWMAQHMGGPVQMIIFDGNALYLERGNRFSRVVGPGDKIPFLEWHETIKYVVDLRPRVRQGKFEAWTKDGIKIQLEARLECRIGNPETKEADSSLVYPFDPLAVKKAVERYAVRWPKREEGSPEEFDWVDATWGQVTGVVPSYIGSRVLDDLFIANRNSGQILSPLAVQEIFEKLNHSANVFGVYVTDFQILKIEIPKAVEEHQKELWMAERQGISTKIDGQAKAFNIRTREKARADAQYDLIMAIAEGLERNENGQFTEPILLSLSSVLDESLRDPATRAYLARETLDTLEQLQKLLGNNQTSTDEYNDTRRTNSTS